MADDKDKVEEKRSNAFGTTEAHSRTVKDPKENLSHHIEDTEGHVRVMDPKDQRLVQDDTEGHIRKNLDVVSDRKPT